MQDTSLQQEGSRRTFGYLVSHIQEPVMHLGWLGMHDAAIFHDVNLICMVGWELQAPGFNQKGNIVYSIIPAGYLDGVVVHSSSLNPYVSPDELKMHLQHYDLLPWVSSAGSVQGAPSVSVDMRQGMREVVNHLIEAHGRRRIAFISGPEGHQGAIDRYHGYRDALEQHGIAFDENLVTSPTSGWLGGREACAGLLQEITEARNLTPGQDIDAIAAISDQTAIQLLLLLQEKGIQVPQQVSVAGFNDIAECVSIIPALTSVRLPFYEKGTRSLETLLGMVETGELPGNLVLPSEPIIRQSCGCAGMDHLRSLAAYRGKPVAHVFGSREWVAAVCGEMTAEMGAATTLHAQVERMVLSFVQALTGADGGAFHNAIEALFRQYLHQYGEVSAWDKAMEILRLRTLPQHESDIQAILRLEDLLHQAHMLIGEVTRQEMVLEEMEVQRHAQALNEINQAMAVAFNLHELVESLAHWLPQLGISACYLALYEDWLKEHDQNGMPEFSRLVLAYHPQGRLPMPADGLRFRTQAFLPKNVLPNARFTFVLMPLFFREYQLGFLVLGVGPRNGSIYHALSSQISSALKGLRLFDEARKARVAAEKADQLKTRLLANVSHELRTPLNVILSSAQRLQQLQRPGVYAAQSEVEEVIHRVEYHAEHQLRLINDLLDLSRAEIDELDLYKHLLDPKPLIEETFESISCTCEKSLRWRIEMPDFLPLIEADPVRLRQVLLNLLSNASKFTDEGEIVLGVNIVPPNLHIWVHDSGPGISESLQEKIFEPFVTGTHLHHREPGVGLGLSITRRLIALHQGTLLLESAPGSGSTFHIYLPLPAFEAHYHPEAPVPGAYVVLISATEEIPSEIADFCSKQMLAVQVCRSVERLEALLRQELPAAFVMELSETASLDPTLFRRIQNHPRLAQTPFLLYAGNFQSDASFGVTGILQKMDDERTLSDLVFGMVPSARQGWILVADDDPAVRSHHEKIVTNCLPGARVVMASNGMEAVGLMEAEAPALVLLDLLMPELDGFGVLDWMRAREETRKTPVLILSNHALTQADVRKIEQHAQVTVQNKGLFTQDEIASALLRSLSEDGSLPQYSSVIVKRTLAYIHQNYRSSFHRRAMAEVVGVSEDYLSRLFCREVGISPWDYLKRYRVQHAQALLRQTSNPVETIALQVGFHDAAYFSRVFRDVLGVSPKKYRDAGS